MSNFYVHRQVEKTLQTLIKQFSAIALTGPRQSGKSTLLKNQFSGKYNYVTLDDLTIREQALSDPRLFLDNIGDYVIIDEIQYAPQILSRIKIMIDENRQKKGYFIFTGSQQFNMMKNPGDSLAGRVALLDLLPFSIEEKRLIPGRQKHLDTTVKCFIDNCLSGSFPEISVDKTIDTSVWYNSYLSTYLERDVRSTYNIENLRDFQLFMRLLAGRCSQELNLSTLSKDLGVGITTIKRWVSILEVSRIIYLLPPYYQNLGKRITKSPKVYFLDLGLVCHLVGIKSKDFLLKGPMAGALCENFYILETIKLFFNNGKKPKLYYLRLRNTLEIDLIIEHDNMELSLLEIKLSKTPKASMAASIIKFMELFPKLNIKGRKILSLADSSMEISKGVHFQGLDDYFTYLHLIVKT
ncbi:MAG: ATP-binding protein [Candidatus Omnitrophota bacterium]